jgi:hypothetical protein
MQKLRTRFVSLRMTDDEYIRLRDAAQGQGARSVSDFARATLLTTFPTDAIAGSSWRQSVDALACRITKLEHDLADIKNVLFLKTFAED